MFALRLRSAAELVVLPGADDPHRVRGLEATTERPESAARHSWDKSRLLSEIEVKRLPLASARNMRSIRAGRSKPMPGDKGDIKPGAKVFIVAVKQADGTLQGRAWRIGRDGVIPPM